MTKFCLTLLLLQAVTTHLFAQNASGKYGIGDQVPDIHFPNVMNSGNKEIRLSDFSNKWIILDFWSMGCASCIMNFSKLDSMQREWPDKLQVILVNSSQFKDKKEVVTQFFEKRRNAAGQPYILPTTFGDSVADQYFDYSELPHLIVISPDRKVIATTSSDQITKTSIRNLIDGRAQNFREQTKNLQYDFGNKEFLDQVNPGLLFSSRFYKDHPFFKRSMAFGTGENGLTTHLAILNCSIDKMFKLALGDEMIEKTMYELAEPGKLMNEDYCYELVLPEGTTREAAISTALSEISRYSGISYRIESKKTKVYVLKTNSAVRQVYTRGGIAGSNSVDANMLPREFTGYHLNGIINYLDDVLPYQIIDESGENTHLDITFPAGNNEKEIIAALKKQGILLKLGKRKLKTLILSKSTKE